MELSRIEISNDSLVDACKLRNNNMQKRQLKETITAIVRQINDELIIAHREGKHEIITSLPITFVISNMANKDSQRAVWANVIGELKSKSYRVWICPTKGVCRIKITWMSPEDEAEIKYQTQLIAHHTENI
jgi:hypothetical protein